MGKWSKLVGKLAPLPEDTVSPYGRKLLELADGLRDLTFDELAERFETHEARLDAAEQTAKDEKLQLDALTRVMIQKLEDLNMESTVCRGHRWTPSPEPYPQVKDKVALREWAEQNDMADVLQIPHQTLKATVKAALEGDGEIPDGVELYLKTGFRKTKVKA